MAAADDETVSGFAAIFHLDGRPVDPTLLRTMTDLIAARGPDSSGQWIDGSIGLAHVMLRTTLESARENQPLVDETGSLGLTFDGRVDNRDELSAAVRSTGARLRDDTDAELVLRAYECWAEAAAERIIGDFAWVLWDGRKRRLVCARDIVGVRSFYYHSDGRTFRAGSAIPQIFADPSVRREPNEGMAGEYLANAITSRDETLYRDVRRLPPAHLLVADARGIRVHRYYDPDPGRILRYRTDGEYAEHFAAVLADAVRSHLRSDRPVALALSGGLDSSAVVGTAQTMVGRAGAPTPGLETFSLVSPGSEWDESGYIADVVKMWGLSANFIRPDDAPPTDHQALVRRHQDFPQYPNDLSWAFRWLSASRNFRVVLTGTGGDEWFGIIDESPADLVRRFRFAALIGRARAYQRIPGLTQPWTRVLRGAFLPLVPSPILHGVKRLLRRGHGAWISPEFARRIDLRDRLRMATQGPRWDSFVRRDLYRTLTSGFLAHVLELIDRAEDACPMDARHPFLDRRVIEFAFAIPEEQRFRGGQHKFVLRQGMRGLMPETVRLRRTEAEFSESYVRTFDRLGGAGLFESLAIASTGWVVPSVVAGMYRRMMDRRVGGDPEFAHYSYPLWMVFGIDLWFRTMFGNGSSP